MKFSTALHLGSYQAMIPETSTELIVQELVKKEKATETSQNIR